LRRKTEAQRAATAYHEAGHAVVAWYLGVKVHNVTIVPKGDTAGRMQHARRILGKYPEIDDSLPAKVRMGKNLMIWLAGLAAQLRFKPRSVRSYHHAGDYIEAVVIAEHLHGDQESADAFLRYMEIKTRNVVRTPWPQVELVASALLARDTIKGKEVTRLLV
jgi:hypothetical protein